MTRRLFFLLPNPRNSKDLVADLERCGVKQSHVHTIAREDVDVRGLPASTRLQKRDGCYRLERFLWAGNLVVFCLALLALFVLLLQGKEALSIIPLSMLILNVVLGNLFTMNIPSSHISDFNTAIEHREILLLVDVPKARLHDVENRIHKRHPEAVLGGVGWTVEALHL